MQQKPSSKFVRYLWCEIADGQAGQPGTFVAEVLRRQSSLLGKEACIFADMAKDMREEQSLELRDNCVVCKGMSFVNTKIDDPSFINAFDAFWKSTFGQLMGTVISQRKLDIGEIRTMSQELSPLGCLKALVMKSLFSRSRNAGLLPLTRSQIELIREIATVAVLKESDGDCVCFVPGRRGTSIYEKLKASLRTSGININTDQIEAG